MVDNLNIHKSIAHAVRTMAEAIPDEPAFVFPDMELSFGQVWELAQAFAIRMGDAGVAEHSPVTVDTQEPEIMLTAMLAVAVLGGIFVQNPGELDLSAVIDAPILPFHTRNHDETPEEESVEIDPSWSPADLRRRFNELDFDVAGPSTPWIYAHSSGTTGYPKFMAFTQGMMVARSLATSEQYRRGQTVLTSLFPPTSRPFVSRVLGAFLCGCPVAIGRDRKFWQRVGVTMVSASPIQARAMFENAVPGPLIDLIEVPGSRVDPELANLLLKHFRTVDNTYGAGETNKSYTNFCTLGADGELKVVGHRRDSEVEIVDSNGTPCGLGQTGEVRVRNPYTVNGYLNDPSAEAKAFRDGWFHPGDAGRWVGDNVLEIVSRDDDVVNIGGYKMHALAIDRIIRSIDGVADAIAFKNPKPGFRDELFAFLVLEEGASQLQVVASARHRISNKLGAEMVPRRILAVPSLPRRPDGSPDRQACAKRVLEISQKQHGN